MSEIATAPDAAQRPGVFTLVIRSKAALYAAWIPLLKGGGIFLPSNRSHSLGEEVLILLTLLDDPNKIPLQGSVAWINPAHSTGNRPHAAADQRGREGITTRDGTDASPRPGTDHATG